MVTTSPNFRYIYLLTDVLMNYLLVIVSMYKTTILTQWWIWESLFYFEWLSTIYIKNIYNYTVDLSNKSNIIKDTFSQSDYNNSREDFLYVLWTLFFRSPTINKWVNRRLTFTNQVLQLIPKFRRHFSFALFLKKEYNNQYILLLRNGHY